MVGRGCGCRKKREKSEGAMKNERRKGWKGNRGNKKVTKTKKRRGEGQADRKREHGGGE